MAGMARAKDGEPTAERYGLKRVVKPFFIYSFIFRAKRQHRVCVLDRTLGVTVLRRKCHDVNVDTACDAPPC